MVGTLRLYRGFVGERRPLSDWDVRLAAGAALLLTAAAVSLVISFWADAVVLSVAGLGVVAFVTLRRVPGPVGH